MKHELQNIISGKSPARYGDAIQAIARYFRRGKSASSDAKDSKQIKSEEATLIKQYCDQNNFWNTEIDIAKFVSNGAEQKVYLHDAFTVFKLNDSIYYLSWQDYFNNLLLNNYFFPDTAYKLVGFYEAETILYAVVEQDFIKWDESTDLENVKNFLAENGFLIKKNNDYFHPELGIILEDLHDENVLTYQGNLYFIDTVFYLTAQFYK
jgi:Serine/Threonine/Tyrosine Kinase found in polyvalent proteins